MIMGQCFGCKGSDLSLVNFSGWASKPNEGNKRSWDANVRETVFIYKYINPR